MIKTIFWTLLLLFLIYFGVANFQLPNLNPAHLASPTSPPTSDLITTAAAKNAKANAEILREIYQVVFMREPRDRAGFGNWVDSMDQGASIEGVYNGFTHSSEYRKLEIANPGASPQALRAFCEELAVLEVELPNPTSFDASSAGPLPVLGKQDLEDEEDQSETNVVNFTSSTHTQPSTIQSTPSARANLSLSVLVDQYSKLFAGASIYTLKRVIGDEAIQVVEFKSSDRTKFALWYAKWVVHMAKRKVDFGLALRNNPDEVFHDKWALSASIDRIEWEILNRLHRVLNEANQGKPGVNPQSSP